MEEHNALENLTVLDLSRVVAAPFCGTMLGTMGARVIKIERPKVGDDSRAYGPIVNGESAYYAQLNHSKEGITLNLKNEEGKRIFLQLVEKADILLENFRPGVMDRLGLGYDELKKVNDKLIYAACSGFGSYGAYSQRPGYDILGQSMGGLMSITGPRGGEPTRAGNAMGDILAGMNMTIGVLAAVNAREITGKGQRVDVALVDSVVASLENAFVRYWNSGELYVRNGNAYAAGSPYDTYTAKDGMVVLACGNEKMYERFCVDVAKKPEWVSDERFKDNSTRVENIDVLKATIETWTMEHTVSEIVDTALAAGVPSGPVYNVAQVMEDKHIAKEREMIVNIEHPVIGKMPVNGSAVKLMDTMPEVRCPAPLLGQHNVQIYSEFLGLSEDEISVLKDSGVI